MIWSNSFSFRQKDSYRPCRLFSWPFSRTRVVNLAGGRNNIVGKLTAVNMGIGMYQRIITQLTAQFLYSNIGNNMETGTLGIGSNQLLSSPVLPRYISQFIRGHPNIKLSLMDANSTTLENQIIAGNLCFLLGIINHLKRLL